MAFRKKVLTVRIQKKKGLKAKESDKHIAKIARKVMRAEPQLKFWDVDAALVTPTWNGTVHDLSLTPVGTTDSTRIGDELKYTGFNLQIQAQPAAAAPSQLLRVLLFRWKMDDSIDAPTTNEILTTGLVGTLNAPMSHYNFDNYKEKFTIIQDTMFMCDVTKPSYRVISKFKMNEKTQYIAGSTLGVNKIFMLIISGLAAGGPTVLWDYRATFSDM